MFLSSVLLFPISDATPMACARILHVLYYTVMLCTAASGWSKAYTKSGEPYYRNDRDKTTSWDKPAEPPSKEGGGAGSGGTRRGGSGGTAKKSKSEEQERDDEQPRLAESSSREQGQQQPLPPGEQRGKNGRNKL